VAKTWRTQPSASLARSSLVGVAQALLRLGVPDQRGHAGDGGLGDGPDTRCAATGDVAAPEAGRSPWLWHATHSSYVLGLQWMELFLVSLLHIFRVRP